MRGHPLVLALVAAAPAPAVAQIEPVEGIRPAEVRTHALVGATVVPAPGRRLEQAVIVVRDGVVTAVGADVEIPPEARVWDLAGHTIYAGLIDPAVLIQVERDDDDGHWNPHVHPQVAIGEEAGPDEALRRELRELGFAAAAVYPAEGIFRGSGAVLALAGRDADVLAYRDRAAMAAGFDRGSFRDRTYPGSLMGAIALMRQTLYDAQWYKAAQSVWREHPTGQEPPPPSEALAALAAVVDGRQEVLFDVADERTAPRAARIADEFDLAFSLLGSGYEFRDLDRVAALGAAVIVPLDFPDRPAMSSLLEADDVSLREMMTWEQAPTNARRLAEAGVSIALTTHRLEKRRGFHAALRRAIRHGLDEQQALAALTTTPARLLGVDHLLGTIEPGKAANLVVVEGSLFDRKPEIRATWVAGRRHEVTGEPRVTFVGPAVLTASTGAEVRLAIDTKKPRVTAKLPDGERARAKKTLFQHDRLTFVLDGRPFDAEGFVRLSGIVAGERIRGRGVLPDGQEFTFTIERAPDEDPAGDDGTAAGDEADEAEAPGTAAEPAAPGTPRDARAAVRAGAGQPPADEMQEPPLQPAEPDEARRRRGGDEEDEDEDGKDEDFELPPDELVHPLGAFGLREPPQPRNVLITNATIWTCGPEGIIEDGSLYVRDGRIAAVGRDVAVGGPVNDVLHIDAEGRHVTPGLIDCHSHTGISGGVNEFAQTITAEVRIGDVIDPQSIAWYRELAGGLTVANQLHGSANPIGGQNAVVKLKWSQSADDFRMDDAIGGIKFALGENVKRSRGRYPNTRMGVEAIIRDAFIAARDYREKWRRYRALPASEKRRTRPPRRDLELDALVEVLEGERLVHSHSYRQDEILMLIRVAEEFGFTVGTFQHVLEGYKVAEAIAAHGAGASTFSDWWAYKVEVMDAIPYNGALMHDVGVVVSFNSDSSELARRMNTEASKAVRYGDVDPRAALRFVTLNPARQLQIDGRTGSLEPGKDGDFAIWSGSPLSTYSRCEQTWIEGARYFDLETDRRLRAEAAAERQRLVQKILRLAHGEPEGDQDRAEPQEPARRPPFPRPIDEDRPYSCCWSLER